MREQLTMGGEEPSDALVEAKLNELIAALDKNGLINEILGEYLQDKIKRERAKFS